MTCDRPGREREGASAGRLMQVIERRSAVAGPCGPDGRSRRAAPDNRLRSVPGPQRTARGRLNTASVTVASRP